MNKTSCILPRVRPTGWLFPTPIPTSANPPTHHQVEWQNSRQVCGFRPWVVFEGVSPCVVFSFPFGCVQFYLRCVRVFPLVAIGFTLGCVRAVLRVSFRFGSALSANIPLSETSNHNVTCPHTEKYRDLSSFQDVQRRKLTPSRRYSGGDDAFL